MAKKFVCGDCGFAADDERDMDLHMSEKKHNKGSGIMSCTECGFYTGNTKRFAEHDKTAHGSGIAKEIKTKLEKAYGPDFKKKIRREIEKPKKQVAKEPAEHLNKCKSCGKKFKSYVGESFGMGKGEYWCAKCSEKIGK